MAPDVIGVAIGLAGAFGLGYGLRAEQERQKQAPRPFVANVNARVDEEDLARWEAEMDGWQW